MKICIIESPQPPKTTQTTEAHIRQAIEIEKYLKAQGHKAEILYTYYATGNNVTDYDVIIKSYATYYDNAKEQLRIINNNKNAKLFWLTNEYDLEIGGSFCKLAISRPISIIANFHDTRKMFANHYFVNMNALFYQPAKKIPPKKYDVCYYGTYRRDRSKYFKKYFTDERFYLSTSNRNFKKFKSIGCKFTPISKLTWSRTGYDTLGYFKYSLYIEDEHTHNVFNNLADRFYEALSNNTIILFDESCINTLKKSEIENYDDFIITSFKDITKRNYEADLAKQKLWIPTITAEKQKALQYIEKVITS